MCESDRTSYDFKGTGENQKTGVNHFNKISYKKAQTKNRNIGDKNMDAQDSKRTIRTCDCGIPNRGTRIVGGIQAEPNEFPWQVSI